MPPVQPPVRCRGGSTRRWTRRSPWSALLLGWGVLFHAAAGETGRPLMQTWGAPDFGAGAQLWRVRVLPDARVVIAHNSGLGVYDGARFELLTLPGGRTFDFQFGTAGQLYTGDAQGLGAFVPDAQGQWRWQVQALPPEAPALDGVGRVLYAAGWTHYLTRRSAFAFHPERGWRWQSASQNFVELRQIDAAVRALEAGVGWWQFDTVRGEWRRQDWPGFPLTDLTASSEEAGAWYFSNRQQLWRWSEGRFERFAVAAWAELEASRIEALARLPDGGLAVGTRFAGLYQFDADGQLQRRVAPAQLPGERVADIEVDREGFLWLAIDGGLVRIAADDRVTRWDRGLGAFQIERIVRDGDTLWVPTRVGLKRLRAALAPGEAARLEVDRIDRTSVWDLLPTPAGGALVGAGNGLWWLPADGSEAELLREGPRVSALVAADPAATRVYAIAGNALWLVRRESGAYRVDPAEVRALPMHDARWHQGRLWASVDGGGAIRFEELDRWPELSQRRYAEAEGLHAGRLIFARLQDHLLLLGDSNHQVGADGELEAAERLRGLPLLDHLQSDGSGAYWAVDTRSRLLRLRPQPDGALAVVAQLLPGIHVPKRHLWVDPDGTLWTGNDEGLARIAADLAPSLAPALVPRVQRISAGDELRWAGAGTLAVPLALSPTARQWHAELSLPGWYADQPVQWSWRAGTEAEWHALEQPRLHGSVPSAGAHVLTFRATDLSGHEWLSSPLRLDAAPHWHERPLGRLAMALPGLLLLLAVAGVWSHWRTRRLRAAQLQLEVLVALRTAEVQRQADEIRALSEARTRFFAHVSHEFRTPLTLVLGPVRDALSGRHGELPAALRLALTTARRSAERLLKLVNELLDLSRLAAGRFDLHPARHDLAAQLRREIEALQPEAARRGLQLEVVGLADPLQLVYDADQLERIVGNLLGNALKFTPAGGRVTLRLIPAAAEVGIEVEDTGPGVPLAEQTRIFERFQQGSTAAPADAPGTGIGLALVRELVELHRGRIELLSEPGQGACFAVWLPRHLPPTVIGAQPEAAPLRHADESTVTDPADWSTEPASTEAPRVLVVDDIAELRQYLADRLGGLYRVHTARDGDEALALISESRPDVVVSDVMMPGRDGYALLRALRADPDTAGVPVLLLSARSRTRDVVAGLEAGADDYLAKPFEPAELIARIQALLDRRRWLRRELLAGAPADTAVIDSPAESDAADAVESAVPYVPGTGTPDPADRRFRERLTQLVTRAAGDPHFGVAELAAGLHMDRATLFRRLKSTLGMSPSDYLRERRLQLARELLEARRGNVSEVAYAVGYESLSHFTQAFRRRFGCTPSAVLERKGIAAD
ncbi:MAG: response regulator [Xanthomonadales bacterium]|jgi:signal transduction histidine kinase/AraC-like DNA-binding protein/AmiR/NasT family two-component response regulator|nr:response regulator [Xanthomonadales bacterium]